jgi:hypothetical protein|tara:strand:+ start:249 stop:404 length:156 start_codon:yes stop_codon:yes gene_type:complete
MFGLNKKKKKPKNKLKINGVKILKKKSEGTGWGKITRQKDQKRLEELLKDM